jgi:hypothetical protein
MFNLLQRHSEDICFRCGNKIGSAAELTIEHKQPWLDVSADLFWDLSNMAFSHASCNLPDRPRTLEIRTAAREGEAWCNGCKSFLPVESFPRDKNGWKVLSYRCRNCKNKQREWRSPPSLRHRLEKEDDFEDKIKHSVSL